VSSDAFIATARPGLNERRFTPGGSVALREFFELGGKGPEPSRPVAVLTDYVPARVLSTSRGHSAEVVQPPLMLRVDSDGSLRLWRYQWEVGSVLMFFIRNCIHELYHSMFDV